MRQELIAAIVICFISLMLIIFPKKVWKMAESWKSKEISQPSNIYKIICRCVGTVMIIVAIIINL